MVGRITTGELVEDTTESVSAAAELGGCGGLKSGKARAATFSPTKRAAIARKPAKARGGSPN